MSDDKKNGGGCIGLIAIPLFLAVLTGGTLPWWWDDLLDFISPDPPPFTLLPTGYYDAEGSMNNSSSRYIATIQGRSCIALVKGQATPYAGAVALIISPLSWRNNSFYIDATNTKLIIDDSNNSFQEGGDKSTWRFQQEEIPEPYMSRINECLRNSEYQSTREILGFSDGISLNSPQSDSSDTNVHQSSPEVLKVQDFADGDYFFASGQPPDYFGDIFLFRKQGNIVIGWGGSNPGDGSCIRQEILSNSQVRTEKITQYDGEVEITPPVDTDGSFWSLELSQVDVAQYPYPDFAEKIQACVEAFPN
jgi:hypothetical protein